VRWDRNEPQVHDTHVEVMNVKPGHLDEALLKAEQELITPL
jgi:hypothetical protein